MPAKPAVHLLSREKWPVLVVGAGPAGATAAWQLAREGIQVALIEQLDRPGGIARTEQVDSARFDIGGHRFFTRLPEIEQIWHHLLGDQLRTVTRLSRIYFRGQFLEYPIRLGDVISKLGLAETLRILLSFIATRLNPRRPERSFEDWVVNRYGRRLFDLFFRAYTEKVWGISCQELSADWAAQRIRSMSLMTVLRQAILGRSGARSLATQFLYPRLGVGQMWEAMVDEIRRLGGSVFMGHRLRRIYLCDSKVAAVEIAAGHESCRIGVDHLISSMPLRELVLRLRPRPPQEVLAAARALRSRALIEVVVALRHPNPFPDQWVYVHDPAVRLGRVQNYRNWSPDMVPGDDLTVLGLEYFAWPADSFYRKRDDALISLGIQEAVQVGLVREAPLVAARVVRVPAAYPVYDEGYRDRVRTIRRFLEQIQGLQTIGRAGLHRYNNMDHSMLTGLLAARNLMGENHDVWSVNEDERYLES